MSKWQYRVSWFVNGDLKRGPWIDLAGHSGIQLLGYEVVEFQEVNDE